MKHVRPPERIRISSGNAKKSGLRVRLASAITRLARKSKEDFGRLELKLELNDGCSVQCPFCCELQISQPNNFMKPSSWRDIIDVSVDSGVYTLVLGTRSDALDYEHSGIDVKDVILYALSKGMRIQLTTAVPRGKEQLFFELLELPIGIRLSFSFMNERRLLNFGFRSLLDQLGIEKAHIPALFLPDRELSSVDSSILSSGKLKKINESRIPLPRYSFSVNFFEFEGELPEDVKTIGNAMVLSNLLKKGAIKPGGAFLLEAWGSPEFPILLMANLGNFLIGFRNWDIHPIGRVAAELDSNLLPTPEEVLSISFIVDPSQEIYTVRNCLPTEDPSGWVKVPLF